MDLWKKQQYSSAYHYSVVHYFINQYECIDDKDLLYSSSRESHYMDCPLVSKTHVDKKNKKKKKWLNTVTRVKQCTLPKKEKKKRNTCHLNVGKKQRDLNSSSTTDALTRFSYDVRRENSSYS